MDYPELRNTTFGEVFAELLETRGLAVTPFKVGSLAEECGLDGWAFISRMASVRSRRLMHLDLRLAEKLELSEPEKMELALAFTYERRGALEERRTEEAGHAPYELLAATNGALASAIDLLDDVPPEAFGSEDDYFRAKRAIAEAGGLVVEAQSRVSDRGRPADTREEGAS